MDYAVTKPKKVVTKRVVAIALGVLVVLGGIIILANTDFTTLRIDRSQVTTGIVKRGTLEIKARANGQLLPSEVEYVASQVNARVVKVHVKPGAEVEAGTLLADLSNPQLVAAAAEAKSAWQGAVAEEQASRAELHANLLSQKSKLAEAKFNMERTRTIFSVLEPLAKKHIISALQYEEDKLNAAQAVEQLGLEQQRFEAVRKSNNARMAVNQSRVSELSQAMNRANDQVANLKIVAGIDGVVQAISIDSGQQLQPGAPIGRIARPDRLYAELLVAAREASDVQKGQSVIVDTRNGIIKGAVARIDPAVNGGTVIVDVGLKGAMPSGARPQLAVEGTILVSRLSDTLYVARPSFVKAHDTVAVYKLDQRGSYAVRVPIEVGEVSLNDIQVLGGLDAGDRIVTSDTSGWQGKDRVLLN